MSLATVLHFWWCFWPKSGIKPSTGPVFEPSMGSYPLLSVPTCPQGSSRCPRSILGLYEVPSGCGGRLSTAGSTLCEHASERRLWAVLPAESWYLLTVVSGACPGDLPGARLVHGIVDSSPSSAASAQASSATGPALPPASFTSTLRRTCPDPKFLDGHRSEGVTGRSFHVSGSAPSRLIGCVPLARPTPTAAPSLLISRMPILACRAHAHAESPLDQSTFQMRAPWLPETTEVTLHTSTCPTRSNIVSNSHPLVSPHTPNSDPAHHQQPSRGCLWACPRRISGRKLAGNALCLGIDLNLGKFWLSSN